MTYMESSFDIEGYVPFTEERVREYQDAGHWQNHTFHELLDDTAERRPEALFTVGPHGKTTYAEAVERSKRVAGYLSGELGLKPSDRAILQLSNRVEFLDLFFGCSRAGVIPVMVLSRHREAEVRHVVDVMDATAYVTLGDESELGFNYIDLLDDVAADADSLNHCIAVGGDGLNEGWIPYSDLVDTDWTADHGAALDAIDVNPNDPGVMLLSGGTTGMPKGIPRTHNDYVFQWKHMAAAAQMTEDWVNFPCVPIGHNASLNPIVGGSVFTGATIATEPVLKTEALLDRIVEDDVDYFFAVPTQLVDILEFEDIDAYDLSGVEAIISGGQKVPPRIVREFNRRWDIGFNNIFGMAEGPLICSRPDDSLDIQAETVGRPIAPGADEVRIVNMNREEEVPAGEAGELAVRGPGFFTGYYRNPEENAENFDDEGWFYTEDVLARREDGNYEVYGRIKDTIIRGGENIYAPGVEDELIEHSAVANVALVGMPDDRLGERPCAFIELAPSANEVTVEELSAFLNERGIAVFKHPERVEVVDELPRTEVGKIEKVALKDRITEWLKTEGHLPEDY